MALLDDVKLALRIQNSAFDTEIQDEIDAAMADLAISGMVNIDETDPLIKQAIKVYVKANFGLANPDSEKYRESYDMLKRHLCLANEYRPAEEV